MFLALSFVSVYRLYYICVGIIFCFSVQIIILPKEGMCPVDLPEFRGLVPAFVHSRKHEFV